MRTAFMSKQRKRIANVRFTIKCSNFLLVAVLQAMPAVCRGRRMDNKNHNKDRKRPVMRKRFMIAAFIAVFACIALLVFQYLGFISKTVYEESVSHLAEVFHQSDNMLRELTDKNLTYLHMWGENLQNISNEDEIRDCIKKAQENAGFVEFFFLSADGLLRMQQFPENPSCLFLPLLRLMEFIRALNMMRLPLPMKTLIS